MDTENNGTENYLVGIDVGTGSVRAALVDSTGQIITTATHEIEIWNPQPDYFQQSSENIWKACCTVIKNVTKSVPVESIKGLGFDATCSLVVIDQLGEPVSVSLKGEKEQNIIMWMDHRAEKETTFINSLNHSLLKFVGGKVSLEMEVPKLLWLKKNLKRTWEIADKFFDLPDFLTWRATGCDSRSLCSVVCKWMYEAASKDSHGWNEEFYKQIGLEELLDNNCYKIGGVIKAPGEPCGKGLNKRAADETGLKEGTPVATSIIDAHAGGVGVLGCTAQGIPETITNKLALICGTSTCHMIVNKDPIFVNGVWGPYYGVMIPGMWLNEGGQSATGKLLDHIIQTHPIYSIIKAKIGQKNHVVNYLNSLLDEMALRSGKSIDYLTSNVHVLPDFHGNRSPVADPTLKGMICGLDLSSNEEQLAILYLATIQSLAYGTRHIMEVLIDSGHNDISCLLVCGGLSKNRSFLQTQANAISRPVLIPQQVESVLLGSAILAATASGLCLDMQSTISKMAGPAEQVLPQQYTKQYHEQKYKVFKKMLGDQLEYKMIMDVV